MRHVWQRPHPLRWLTVAVVCVVFGAPGAGVQTAAAAAEQEIHEAVRKYIAGYASNTVEGYFQNYAPDVTMWWPNGLRQQRETYRKTWEDSLQKGITVESADFEDLRIHAAPSGDAGVASFIWKIKRKGGDLAVASYLLKVTRRNPGPNRSPNVTYEMSPTLVKRGGNWTIVHLHFQVVPEPKPGA